MRARCRFVPKIAILTTHISVTEYGVAQLWGKSARQRAEALTAKAHPHFRAENQLIWAAASGSRAAIGLNTDLVTGFFDQ